MVDFSPYSSIKPYLGGLPVWYPEEAQNRVASYAKYDALYWNDDTQFQLRLLDGEQPIYVPNARTIVNTTSYYLLKGLKLTVDDPEKHSKLQTALTNFLDRELFYHRFHIAKLSGVARGDFVFHLTANPRKPVGSRISLTSIDPGMVIPVYDDDNLDKLLRVHIVDMYVDAKDPTKQRIRKLTYEYEYPEDSGDRRVSSEEAIYELEPKWWGPKPVLYKTILPKKLLDPEINTIPIYWFKNMDWQGQEFGSSELRGFERLIQGVSQATTDQGVALALEGLGVYATDGGRPVNKEGVEVDWEVSPGRVMEVPSGAYFRRVEGIGSIKPSMDHIEYIERKLFDASGLPDVSRGRVDVAVAQSGIALEIQFTPTLAKMEERDIAGIGKLKQLWFDWIKWMKVYENVELEGRIIPEIGAKLPTNRIDKLNELNNMFDRDVISAEYYRAEMQKLGYEFPRDIADKILEEAKAKVEIVQNNTPATDEGAPPGKGGDPTKSDKPANQSNNKGKPNESGGTEATSRARGRRQGGKP